MRGVGIEKHWGEGDINRDSGSLVAEEWDME